MTNGAVVVNANQTYYWQFVAPINITIASVRTRIGTGVGSANIRVGIYSHSCVSGTTLLAQTGNIDATVTNTVATTAFASSATVALVANTTYWMGITADQNGAQLWRNAVDITPIISPSGQTLIAANGAASTGSAGTLTMPANCGSLSASSAVNPPLVGLLP